MKEALIGTFYHIIELATCLIASLVILRFFNLGTDETGVIAGVAVNALVKFSRSHPSIPVNDYTRPVK